MASVDLAMMLYLNPELAAYSNLNTLTAAEAAWSNDQGSGGAHSLSLLPYAKPSTPVGFDPKVYLAAQPNVSPLNQTIYASMTNMGFSSNAMMRRGVYVSTLMEEVIFQYSSNSGTRIGLQLTVYEIGNEPFRFSSCNLNSGDYVRLQRQTDGRGTCGVPLYGQVVSVASGSNFVLNPMSPAAFNSDSNGCIYILSGIRIWDVERQALVAFARNSSAFSNALSNAGGGTPSNLTSFPGYVDSNDIVPRPDFNLDAYRSAYPDVKLLDFSDAYLDYRMRWKRADEYRIVSSKDILNLEAPYASNISGGGGGGYGATGYNASFSNNLTVNGNIGIGMACTGSEGYSTEIDAWNVYHGTGASNAWWMGAGSNTRLAVAGDIFATGTVISLSDSRVKSCIQPIDNALGRLSFLTGYTYDMNGSAKRHTGLLAQDVAKALPEAVFYRSAEGILEGNNEKGPVAPVASVAYGNLAGLFVNAINELSDRISKIESRMGGDWRGPMADVAAP
jgi:hypothetical protein